MEGPAVWDSSMSETSPPLRFGVRAGDSSSSAASAAAAEEADEAAGLAPATPSLTIRLYESVRGGGAKVVPFLRLASCSAQALSVDSSSASGSSLAALGGMVGALLTCCFWLILRFLFVSGRASASSLAERTGSLLLASEGATPPGFRFDLLSRFDGRDAGCAGSLAEAMDAVRTWVGVAGCVVV